MTDPAVVYSIQVGYTLSVMSRFVFALLAALFLSPVVFAQAGDPAPPPDPAARPFSLIPILETVSAGEISWRPDWPVEMPPDLFAVSGEARSVTVTLEFPAADPPDPAYSPEPADRFEYVLARDGAGRLTDFPFFMDGGFFQTGVSYDRWGRIAGLTISAAVFWRVEFMRHDDETGLPVLARLNAGSAGDDVDSGGAWF
ncbi:MAG: hypothetical protein LBS57_13870, partial [Treponema sp.]|nr:hypothetical protein [Treponema sp.]